MIRRVLLLALTAAVLVSLLSGCGGPGLDEASIKAAIGLVIGGFKADIEAYDVDGALSCLSGPGFMLTLGEAGHKYDKTYEALQSELEADEDNQLYWREEYGYRLELLLGTRTFSNVTSTGAVVTQSYQVRESATAIAEMITDKGTMVWHFAKISGLWKATSLYITFEPVVGTAGVQAVEPSRTLLGFGRLPAMSGWRRWE